MRHRSHATEANTSGESATDSAKSYTSEQLDAVKRFKFMSHIQCFMNVIGKIDSGNMK